MIIVEGSNRIKHWQEVRKVLKSARQSVAVLVDLFLNWVLGRLELTSAVRGVLLLRGHAGVLWACWVVGW